MSVLVNWEDVQKFVQEVNNEFKNRTFTGVYGIPRGGCVLAVMLSHSLNIPLLMAPYKGCLIVDDICDSGESLIHYRNNTSGQCSYDYTIVTMYYNPDSIIRPDFYKEFKYNGNWIKFPWEDSKCIMSVNE